MKINKGKPFRCAFAAAGLSLVILASSCGTTKNLDQTDLSASAELPAETQQPQEEKAPSPLELYKAKTDGITLSVVSAPGETTKGRAFSKPYVVKAADASGNAVPGFQIASETPFSPEKTVITTDESGTASYLPPLPEKSSYSEIKFFPDGDMSNTEIAEEAEKLSVSAPYKVQTNRKSAGGVIAVVDFSKSEKPITSNPVSSSNLLMSLMKLGFTRIGNIDLTNDVLKDDPLSLQKKARAMVGNTAAYLVYGTVKYKSVEKKEDGTTTVSLIGKIKALDLKTGEILFEEEKDSSVNGKNEWNALRDARINLADSFASALKYGI